MDEVQSLEAEISGIETQLGPAPPAVITAADWPEGRSGTFLKAELKSAYFTTWQAANFEIRSRYFFIFSALDVGTDPSA